MTLRNRLARLEGHRRPASVAPSIVFICDDTGDPGGAIFAGGGGIERQPNETADGFKACAEHFKLKGHTDETR